MRSLIVCALVVSILCFLAPVSAAAQENLRRERGHGYVSWGIGAVNFEDKIGHGGVGCELNLYKGLGLGVEVGAMAPLRSPGDGIGILSVDGQYTFGTGGPGKVRPFLTGGYTLAFREGHANAVNFGAGVHYWFSRHFGLRLEFRDHVSPELWNAHAWLGRVGFDFR